MTADYRQLSIFDVSVGDWVTFRPELCIGGRWEVMRIEGERLWCRAEFSALTLPGFWIGQIEQLSYP
jgi:hypothetical protein